MRPDVPWVRVPPLVRVPADGCPHCRKLAIPARHHDHGDDRTCFYRCPNCGLRWCTHWSLYALGGPDPETRIEN